LKNPPLTHVYDPAITSCYALQTETEIRLKNCDFSCPNFTETWPAGITREDWFSNNPHTTRTSRRTSKARRTASSGW